VVRRGEYLERMVVIRSGDLHLEGLYHRGRIPPPAVIAPPHPQQGGEMDNPVVAELAWAITRAGHATLRFNYRGVGASEGGWSGGPGEVDDLAAAVDQLRETTGAAAVTVAGYSFGAWAAVEVARRRVEVGDLVLVAPPTVGFDLSGLAEVRGRILAVHGSADSLVDPAALDRLLAPLGNRARRVALAGADHWFGKGLAEVGREAAAFVGQG
jgi:alpha/beta superfamily hydrolase